LNPANFGDPGKSDACKSGWRKVEPDTTHPKRDHEAQEVFKKLSGILDEAGQQNVLNRPVLLMFLGEARFGRISEPRKCRATTPFRSIVKLALVRKYAYAYAAVSSKDGALDLMLAVK
jgi:hypothetical protein